MPVFCTRCGTVARDDDAFCARCGRPIAGPPFVAGAAAPQRGAAGAAIVLGGITFELAGVRRRVGGWLLDLLFVWLAASVGSGVWLAVATVREVDVRVESSERVQARVQERAREPRFNLIVNGLWIVLWTAHGLVGTASGGTLGKRAVGVRVVGAAGRRPGVGRALLRVLASYGSVVAFGLGFAWAVWDGKRQTWHDKVAGTYVVQR